MQAQGNESQQEIEAAHPWKFQTQFCCDSVEFCPAFGLQHVFVCGNYELLSDQKRKVGKVYAFAIERKESAWSVRETDSQDIAAVLDLKWSWNSLHEGKPLVAGALENGTLQVLSLDPQTLRLQTVAIAGVDASLCLSLDWNNRVLSNEARLITSLSNGKLAVCRFGSASLDVTSLWQGHEYEAWIGAFDYFHPEIVFSGADDCMFKGWDLRQPTNKAMFQKSYNVGVTTIQSNPHHEHQITVGSYDENISIWDLRAMKLPFIRQEGMNGGVWRVKWHPHNSALLLAACMRGGFKTFHYNPNDAKLQLQEESHTKCEELAYGADWCCLSEWQDLIITGTFYDRRCSLWYLKSQEKE